MRRRVGWPAVGEWAVAFGLLALAVIGAMSIGILVFPFAIVALVLAVRRDRGWPEAPAGALVGFGSICLFVAFINRAYSPCPPGPMRLAQGQHFSCGGFDPMPWLTIGVLLTIAGVGGYIALRRTHFAALRLNDPPTR